MDALSTNGSLHSFYWLVDRQINKQTNKQTAMKVSPPQIYKGIWVTLKFVETVSYFLGIICMLCVILIKSKLDSKYLWLQWTIISLYGIDLVVLFCSENGMLISNLKLPTLSLYLKKTV